MQYTSETIRIAVESLIMQAADEIILPRFRNLEPDDVSAKTGSRDLVTIADQESEAFLTKELQKLIPGSLVVGEEAVSENKDVLRHVKSNDPVWIIDPLDGTYNFANGKNVFAAIVALVVEGRVQAGWIYDIPNKVMTRAIRGEGAARDMQELKAETVSKAFNDLSAYVHFSFFHKKIRAHPSIENMKDRLSDQLTSLWCAGCEYASIANGEADFALYTKMKPWDHVAGQLIIEESGGKVAIWDGSEYSACHLTGGGLLVARTPEIWDRVQAEILQPVIDDGLVAEYQTYPDPTLS